MVEAAPTNPDTMLADLGAVDTPRSTAPVHFRIDSIPDGLSGQQFPKLNLRSPRAPVEGTPKAERPCQVCARPLTYVATMRGNALRPQVTVYRCNGCKRIETEEK